jgi:hypothetical protein
MESAPSALMSTSTRARRPRSSSTRAATQTSACGSDYAPPGEKVALPEARRRAPHKSGRLRSSLVVKSRARDAVLTTSLTGKKARYIGLMEYGGTVRTTIEPKRKKAIVINGQPVARVTEPRTYRARHFLSGAVDAKHREIDQALLDETLKAFDGFETR